MDASELLRPFRDDFLFYAPRALSIRAKSGAIVPLELNRAQLYLHNRIEEQRKRTGKVRIVGLKGRQQGFSTYVEGRYYWKVSGEFGKRAFILTHLAEATKNIFGMTKRYHDNCPDALKPHTKHRNDNELVFDILQSEFSVATAGSAGTGRSATAQYFHGSEVAFWDNAVEHMAGIGQIIPNEPGTEIILESTANGIGNLFHGMVEDAERGIGEYELVFVPWYWQEEYRMTPPDGWVPTAEDAEYGGLYGGLDAGQLYWRRQKINTDFRGDASLFDQEYPATTAVAFRASNTNGLILVANVVAARKAANVEASGVRIVGLDVAEYGDDDSALAYRQGRVCHTLERVHGLGPMELVGWAANRLDKIKPDVVNVDCTGIGSGVADRLLELGYPVKRVHFGERAIENDLYVTRADEMWCEMAAWLEDRPAKIPDDNVLERELVGRMYGYDSSRRKKIESKEKMKDRGLKSPDGGDALALTFAHKVAAGAAVSRDRIALRGRSSPSWRIG